MEKNGIFSRENFIPSFEFYDEQLINLYVCFFQADKLSKMTDSKYFTTTKKGESWRKIFCIQMSVNSQCFH